MKLLKTQSSKEKDNCISEDLYDVIIECLSERSTLRKAWKDRYSDPVFEKIPEDERPFNCSCLDRVTKVDQMEKCLSAGQMPEDLDGLIEKIRLWRSAFVESSAHKSEVEAIEQTTKKQKKGKVGSLTRKEQKRVASNWEMLKKKL